MIVNQLDFVAADVDQLLGFYMQRSDRQEAILGELVAGIEEFAVGCRLVFSGFSAFCD